jgi:hypothetical protein
MGAQHYQGNAWWIFASLFSLFLLFQILWRAWQKRKVGIPVDVESVAALSLCFLIFFALAIYQVLTH